MNRLAREIRIIERKRIDLAKEYIDGHNGFTEEEREVKFKELGRLEIVSVRLKKVLAQVREDV